jgi:cysteinyl-tRNA synthetase
VDPGSPRRKFDDVLQLIGNTPLVSLSGLNPNPRVELWGKLEGCNPGGSIKDRIALSMIEAAEESGQLKPGMTILEATSGNTGIGLAMVSAIKGYKLLLTMSEAVSIERRKILAAYGAEFLLTPGKLGTDGAIERAYDLADEQPERYVLVDQYNNPANPLAHYNGTAPEIWEQTDGRITHFVAALGTTGTVMGCSRRLKELNPDVKVIAVEPQLDHKLQGLKSLKEAYVPGIFDKSLVDEKIEIADEDAFETSRRLVKAEGMLLGMSAGAAVFVALELAKDLREGVMVLILPDFGERYLSTDLFTA